MLEFPVTSMCNRFLSIYDTTFSSVQWPRRQMPVEPKYFTSVHRRSLSNKVSHATPSQDISVTMWHPPKTSVWHPPCKYSVQRFDHSHATRLQQFNTNYFHLTGAAIKTVSPSDWDSCLCAARVLWRNVDCAQLPPLCSSPLFVLCASLYLHFASLPPSCRQQLDAPITPKCPLANFPPDRQNNVVIRRVCRANWDLLRWDGCN